MEKNLYFYLDEQVEKNGEAAALIDSNGVWSYRQLKEFSEVVKNVLLSKQIEPEEKVLILCKKSYESIAAMMGTMKAGACFIPYNLNRINKDYPDMLKRSKIEHIVIDSSAYKLLQEKEMLFDNLNYYFIENQREYENRSCPVIVSDAGNWILIIETMDVEEREVEVKSDMLAYIIYTSGTTNTPKGVMITHKSICPVVECRCESLEWNQQTVTLSIAPQNFDMFIIELFCTLRGGGTVVLVDKWRIVEEVFKNIETYKVTNFITVPTLFTLISRRKENLRKFNISSLRGIGFGGGKCPVPLLKEVDHYFNGKVQFYHGYGLTETACHALYYTVPNPQEISTSRLPLGKAIKGTTAYVLDEEGKPVQDGEVGELVISGYHIMKGYYMNQEETEKRIKKKLIDGKIQKVLQTGDLVRLVDGQLFFVCRKDDQIKSAGHRIELDEIEVKISSFANVVECAVIAVPDEVYENKIWCFAVLKQGENELAALKKAIDEALVTYMRPHKIILLDELPRSQNRKIDKKNLYHTYYKEAVEHEQN